MYAPRPIDTTTIRLSRELEDLVERPAVHVRRCDPGECEQRCRQLLDRGTLGQLCGADPRARGREDAGLSVVAGVAVEALRVERVVQLERGRPAAA